MFRSPSLWLCYCSKHCSYYTLDFFSFFSICNPPSLLHICTCVCEQSEYVKGVRRGALNPQRGLGSCSSPSRFIALVLPKSYFMVPSIRSLGSPQLPSPDAGLSPSLGTQTGHGERRHVTHVSTARDTNTPIIFAQRETSILQRVQCLLTQS